MNLGDGDQAYIEALARLLELATDGSLLGTPCLQDIVGPQNLEVGLGHVEQQLLAGHLQRQCLLIELTPGAVEPRAAGGIEQRLRGIEIQPGATVIIVGAEAASTDAITTKVEKLTGIDASIADAGVGVDLGQQGATLDVSAGLGGQQLGTRRGQSGIVLQRIAGDGHKIRRLSWQDKRRREHC